ncbi:MAG: Uma2 family endonuclease [Lachnospiraceae bacterium]|nr:Uma2 family endonuclease [Lachnospiraceae bacterium]
MTIAEMIQRKKEMGYSNKQLAELSGVPLGTIQKIFSGSTETPRYQTVQALSKVLEKKKYSYERSEAVNEMFMETSSYASSSSATDTIGKTMEDYLALPEGTRIEMIDGVFYDMAAPTVVHQRIGAMIFNVFENHINKNGGKCIAAVAPTDVQLDCDDKTMVQPDVLVVCDRDKIIKARVVGAPDLIVEVLSPSNWFMDIIKKKDKYKNAGVREYWIVLPEHKKVLVYHFESSSDYTEYSFEDRIPVAIWNNKCEVDFKFIYSKVEFLYDR